MFGSAAKPDNAIWTRKCIRVAGNFARFFSFFFSALTELSVCLAFSVTFFFSCNEVRALAADLDKGRCRLTTVAGKRTYTSSPAVFTPCPDRNYFLQGGFDQKKKKQNALAPRGPPHGVKVARSLGYYVAREVKTEFKKRTGVTKRASVYPRKLISRGSTLAIEGNKE